MWYAEAPNSLDIKGLTAIMQEALAPFYARHRSIDVRIIPGNLPTASMLPMLISGSGPDIFHDNYFAPYAQGGLLLPLRSYFLRDNVDPAIWNPRQAALYQTAHGPLAVPAYTGTTVYAVNLADFDQAGLTYPDASWTYRDFTHLAATLAKQDGAVRHYGADVMFGSGGPWNGEDAWVFRAFGGSLVSPSGPPSRFAAPSNLAALRWLYHDLFWPQVATVSYGGNVPAFIQHQRSMAVMGTWMLADLAASGVGQLKWDFLPSPVFPSGRTTFCSANFSAISAATRHAEEAWELLRWLSVEPYWARANIKIWLASPILNSLWSEWAAAVQQVAPPLKGKALNWYGDAAGGGYAYPAAYYPHDDSLVNAIMVPYFTNLYNHRTSSVAGAARQIDQVVNAFEAHAAAQEAAARSEAGRFPTVGPVVAKVQTGA